MRKHYHHGLNQRGWFIYGALSIWVLVIGLFVFLYGAQLACIASDVSAYEDGMYHNAQEDAIIAHHLERRYALTEHWHPAVAFMATHTLKVWLPFYTVAGFIPLVLHLMITWWLVEEPVNLYWAKGKFQVNRIYQSIRNGRTCI